MTIKSHTKILHLYCTVHFFERFSFYGLNALLLLYFSRHLHYDDAKSFAVLGVLGTLTYATPIFGGYLADKVLGFYRCILGGLILMLVGYSIVFLSPKAMGLYLGLGLIVTGSGFYKSNMNTLMGNLYPKDLDISESAFTMQYVYQNLGAFLAPLVCGYICLTYGWSWGFLSTALPSSLGLCLFLWTQRRRHFPVQKIAPHFLKTSSRILAFLILLITSGVLATVIHFAQDSLHLLTFFTLFYCVYFVKIYFSLTKEERGHLNIIFFGIMAVALSGAMLNHGRTVGTLFMDRHIHPMIGTFHIPSTFVQSIDPLVIICGGPLLAWIWKTLSHKGHHIHSLNKTLIGFVTIVLSYVALTVVCSFATPDGIASLIPFLLSIALLAASDLFIYPNVLAFCNRLAPKKIAGLVMGFVVFGMSLSELCGTYLAQIASIPHNAQGEQLIDHQAALGIYQHFYGLMSLLTVAMLAVMGFYVKRISKKRALWTFIN